MTDLMRQGLELMAVGMGVVFVFLVVLVFVTGAMSRLVARLIPERPQPAAQAAADVPAVPPQTVAVIEEAIRQHRARLSSGRR